MLVFWKVQGAPLRSSRVNPRWHMHEQAACAAVMGLNDPLNLQALHAFDLRAYLSCRGRCATRRLCHVLAHLDSSFWGAASEYVVHIS
jgi:hypothetical protein